MGLPALSKPKSVEFVSLTKLLTDFRRKLESESDEPIEQLEVNAALLLSDLSEHLGLGVAQHDMILGQPAVDYLTSILETRVTIPIHH